MSNLIALLDAYEAARAITDRVNQLRHGADDAETVYQAAIVQEEAAAEAANQELRRLEPELSHDTARMLIALPVQRDRLRAQYGAKNP